MGTGPRRPAIGTRYPETCPTPRAGHRSPETRRWDLHPVHVLNKKRLQKSPTVSTTGKIMAPAVRPVSSARASPGCPGAP